MRITKLILTKSGNKKFAAMPLFLLYYIINLKTAVISNGIVDELKSSEFSLRFTQSIVYVRVHLWYLVTLMGGGGFTKLRLLQIGGGSQISVPNR